MAWSIRMRGILKPVGDDEIDPAAPYTEAAIVVTDTDDLTDEDETEIFEHFRRGCHCAHDCCGHFNGGVFSITKEWDGQHIVLASYGPNY